MDSLLPKRLKGLIKGLEEVTMKTYLSVDVDYWRLFDRQKYMQEMDRFFQKIINKRIPIFIVRDHEELLEDVNKRVFNKLINVDYHSDITAYVDSDEDVWEYQWVPRMPADLNCGTWVNFVEERFLGEFLWLYPHAKCMDVKEEGRCEDIEGFWDDPVSECHNWNCINHKKGLSAIKWNDVISVGISLSPDWLYADLEEFFLLEICPKLEKAGALSSQSFQDYTLGDIEKDH